MSGDTMVLRIGDRMTRIDTSDDTIIFIIYDHEKYQWLIRGSRSQKEFSFYCDDMNDVEHFLNTIYVNYYSITYSLLNYSNLPIASYNINFDLLNKGKDSQTIATYDYLQGNTVEFSKYLKILRTFYNMY